MKRFNQLVIVALMLFGSVGLTAQSQDRFSIGPRAGVNFSTVSNIGDEAESVTGLLLGLTSTYSLNENTGLTLDVLYSSEGYQRPFEEVRLRYLQVPIYFNYFFGELGDRFRPKVYVGAAPGFFLGGTVNELDVNKDYFNSAVISVTGGLGFNYRIANRIWLNTDLRSFIGLSDIRDKSETEGDAQKPSTVSLSVGLAYGLSKL